MQIPTIIKPDTNLAGLCDQYRRAAGPESLRQLADFLGVSVHSLQRLEIGWDGQAWTFPMRGRDQQIVGFRRRFPSGHKSSLRGGHEGLFIPTALATAGCVCIAEGPTDTAAMLTLGYECIGRPSCRGGVRLVRALVRGREVVIVSDNDTPGRAGALVLASLLRLYCPQVRTVYPPPEVKDVRQWVQRGATRADLDAAIDSGFPMALEIQTRTAGH